MIARRSLLGLKRDFVRVRGELGCTTQKWLMTVMPSTPPGPMAASAPVGERAPRLMRRSGCGAPEATRRSSAGQWHTAIPCTPTTSSSWEMTRAIGTGGSASAPTSRPDLQVAPALAQTVNGAGAGHGATECVDRDVRPAAGRLCDLACRALPSITAESPTRQPCTAGQSPGPTRPRAATAAKAVMKRHPGAAASSKSTPSGRRTQWRSATGIATSSANEPDALKPGW
jgi:hypothetical protein